MHSYIFKTAATAIACLSLGTFTRAHSSSDELVIPRLFGRRAIADLRARGAFSNERRSVRAEESSPIEGPSLDKRQSTTTCGSNNGGATCAAGLCCSPSGFCSTGPDYCTSPGCQLSYSAACDGNTVPAGSSTSGVARPLIGSQPYGGAGIPDCLTAGTIALTFDDGPYIYTAQVLDLLKQYGARATFFVTGNNNGRGAIDDPSLPWAALIRRMIAEGHQVASHTWSHQDLSLVTRQQRLNQMYYNEAALRNILGYFPTYMRPPYSSCNVACQTDMQNLGYHITYFDVDTDDYANDSPTLIVNAENNFDRSINGVSPVTNDFLVIAHDIHQYTAQVLVEFMLKRLASNGYLGVTVGECLGDPQANWYRSASGASTFASSSVASSTASSTVSSTSATSTAALILTPDATCGIQSGNRYTCRGSSYGNSCSQNGYCGPQTDINYSGAGCQPNFGLCGPVSSSSSSVSRTSSSVTSTSSSVASTSSIVASSTTAPPSSSSSSSSAAASSTAALTVTPDATCGTQSGGRYTCIGGAYGDSCSVNGWCGPRTNTAYSGAGCQPAYGLCG